MPFPLLALLPVIVPALLPVVTDAVRGIASMVTGGKGARPQNVDEAIKLMTAETDRLKALAELDKPAGEISPWVSNLRASFRYVAAGFIIAQAYVIVFAAGLGANIPAEYVDLAFQAAQSAFSFIFGDRMYAALKSRTK